MRIGLVGGGPSCTAAFIELSRKLAGYLSEIVIFDPVGIFSSPAFNTETDLLLANTSVGVTSILNDNDADFLNWLHDDIGTLLSDLRRFRDLDDANGLYEVDYTRGAAA